MRLFSTLTVVGAATVATVAEAISIPWHAITISRNTHHRIYNLAGERQQLEPSSTTTPPLRLSTNVDVKCDGGGCNQHASSSAFLERCRVVVEQCRQECQQRVNRPAMVNLCTAWTHHWSGAGDIDAGSSSSWSAPADLMAGRHSWLAECSCSTADTVPTTTTALADGNDDCDRRPQLRQQWTAECDRGESDASQKRLCYVTVPGTVNSGNYTDGDADDGADAAVLVTDNSSYVPRVGEKQRRRMVRDRRARRIQPMIRRKQCAAMPSVPMQMFERELSGVEPAQQLWALVDASAATLALHHQQVEWLLRDQCTPRQEQCRAGCNIGTGEPFFSCSVQRMSHNQTVHVHDIILGNFEVQSTCLCGGLAPSVDGIANSSEGAEMPQQISVLNIIVNDRDLMCMVAVGVLATAMSIWNFKAVS